jgi:DNA-directed RNA polymerase I subunit RPA49
MTQDLSLKQTKVNELFKSLGCKINEATAAQKAQADANSEESKGMKRAILTAPLTFPLPKRYVMVSISIFYYLILYQFRY